MKCARLAFLVGCLLGASLTIFVGLIFGFVSRTPVDNALVASHADKEHCDRTGYSFIAPTCRSYVISKGSYVDLELSIEDYFRQRESEGVLREASVFFRDLVDGPTFSINGNVGFVPASLLKVPFAFALYDHARDDTDILATQLIVEESDMQFVSGVEQQYPPSEPLQINQSYTVEALLYHLLVYSDNVAGARLARYMDELDNRASSSEGMLLRTYKELGLVPDMSDGEYVLSVRRNSGLFRDLYFTSFLDPKDSEKILSILSHEAFPKGISGGVPKDVTVAHKFGETKSGTFNQLHDCGIVYFPDNPYLLCIMTRGGAYEALEGIIAQVSRLVYEEVKRRHIEGAHKE